MLSAHSTAINTCTAQPGVQPRIVATADAVADHQADNRQQDGQPVGVRDAPAADVDAVRPGRVRELEVADPPPGDHRTPARSTAAPGTRTPCPRRPRRRPADARLGDPDLPLLPRHPGRPRRPRRRRPRRRRTRRRHGPGFGDAAGPGTTGHRPGRRWGEAGRGVQNRRRPRWATGPPPGRCQPSRACGVHRVPSNQRNGCRPVGSGYRARAHARLPSQSARSRRRTRAPGRASPPGPSNRRAVRLIRVHNRRPVPRTGGRCGHRAGGPVVPRSGAMRCGTGRGRGLRWVRGALSRRSRPAPTTPSSSTPWCTAWCPARRRSR